MPSRPNILLLHSDQHRFDCVGANGAQIVRTPNLDRLAREGANFQRAFCTSPICSPARASLMTGAWPTAHGCLCIPNTELYHPARPGFPVLTQLLHDVGYRIRWTGKFHNEVTGGPTDHGVEEYIPLSDYKAWRAEQGLPPEPKQNQLFGENDLECPDDKSCLSWQADQILRAIDDLGNGDAPFFIRWDPSEPHLPCKPPRESAKLYQGISIPPWPSFPDPLDNKPAAQKRQHSIWGIGGWTWEQWEPVARRYFSVITHLDAQIGRILAKLEEKGLLEDTLILYSTDHGDFCGGHGLIDKHFAMYDDITRVPMIVRWPGRVPAGAVTNGYVSNSIDIAATILGAAGIERPETFVGQDLVELANGRVAQPRESILVQYFGTESGSYSMRAVRTDRFKYVFAPTGMDEFYDLAEDPGELQNRIHDPGMAEQIAAMKALLMEHMQQAKDPLLNMWTRVHLNGEPHMAARAGLATP